MTGVNERKTLQQNRTAGVIKRKTRRAGKPLRRLRRRLPFQGRQPASPQQEHIAPPPAPARTHACAGLYPAKRNISPAHYSLSNEVEKRIATSARTDAWLARLIIK